MKVLFISLSLIFQFFSCQNNGGKGEIKKFQDILLAEQFTKHTDKKNGFEIMYPQNWVVGLSDSFELENTVFEAHSIDSNLYKLIISITSQEIGDTTIFYDYSDMMEDGIRIDINYYRHNVPNSISSKKDLIYTDSGLRLYAAEITHRQELNDERMFKLMAGCHAIKGSKEQTMFLLSQGNSINAENDSTNKILFHKIIKSFRLID